MGCRALAGYHQKKRYYAAYQSYTWPTDKGAPSLALSSPSPFPPPTRSVSARFPFPPLPHCVCFRACVRCVLLCGVLDLPDLVLSTYPTVPVPVFHFAPFPFFSRLCLPHPVPSAALSFFFSPLPTSLGIPFDDNILLGVERLFSIRDVFPYSPRSIAPI